MQDILVTSIITGDSNAPEEWSSVSNILLLMIIRREQPMKKGTSEENVEGILEILLGYIPN